jgi:hypothetical protein
VNEARGDSYDYWVRAGATVGLVAMGIQETVEFSLQMPANAFLFVTLAAMAVCPVRKTNRRAQSMTPTSPMPITTPSVNPPSDRMEVLGLALDASVASPGPQP